MRTSRGPATWKPMRCAGDTRPPAGTTSVGKRVAVYPDSSNVSVRRCPTGSELISNSPAASVVHDCTQTQCW